MFFRTAFFSVIFTGKGGFNGNYDRNAQETSFFVQFWKSVCFIRPIYYGRKSENRVRWGGGRKGMNMRFYMRYFCLTPERRWGGGPERNKNGGMYFSFAPQISAFLVFLLSFAVRNRYFRPPRRKSRSSFPPKFYFRIS